LFFSSHCKARMNVVNDVPKPQPWHQIWGRRSPRSRSSMGCRPVIQSLLSLGSYPNILARSLRCIASAGCFGIAYFSMAMRGFMLLAYSFSTGRPAATRMVLST